MKQRSIEVTDEEIKQAYDSGKTLHQVAVELKMTNVTLWRRAKGLGLYWKELKRKRSDKISLMEILDGKHPHYQTFKLKNRLISENVKENKCDSCGIIEWNGKPLTMQLDHIDGDSHNHKFDNIQFLCPNCHAQTDTYCGKNK